MPWEAEMMFIKSNHGKSLLFSGLFIILFVSGCATYKDGTQKAFNAVEKGNYPVALVEMKKAIKPDGNDRLVYFMEIGLLEHLNGQYELSNQNLSRAASIGEELETKRAGDTITAALTSPRSGEYQGSKFERAFVHYYKALNYIKLAAKATRRSDIESLLEGARIESRRVDILLTAIQNEEGTYQEVKDKKGKLFGQLLEIYRKLDAGIDTEALKFREDAYIRYMSGVIYEANKEYDDARIAYQQSAKLYEDGFAEQYSLGNEITAQAWFDTIRMMQWAGGYENQWPALAEQKLSTAQRDQLKNFEKGTAQLLLIEHLGMIPHRDELNIHLTVDQSSQELIVKPVYSNDPKEKHDQFSWFYTMYAEKGLLSAVSNYNARGVGGVIQGLESKRFGLGPAWGLAEQVGLIKAIGVMGVRITVPYYRPSPAPFGISEVWINGNNKGKMVLAESLAELALQEQIVNSGSDLQFALARETVKALLGDAGASVAGQMGGDDAKKIIGFLSKIANTATSQAETRNWLTLPYAIKIKRIPLKEGDNTLRVMTKNANGVGIFKETVKEINVGKGELYILRNRSASIHQTMGATQSAKIETKMEIAANM